VAAGVGLVTIEIASLLERMRERAYAADRALLGATLGVVVPLVLYALYEAVYRKERTTALVAPLGRHGADRRLLSVGIHVALALACAGTTALCQARRVALGKAATRRRSPNIKAPRKAMTSHIWRAGFEIRDRVYETEY
jgi:hypothetical protein